MIIIPAQMEGFRTLKDKTLKVTFETNELNPQELLGIAENINTFGYLAFKKEPFGEKEKGNAGEPGKRLHRKFRQDTKQAVKGCVV